MNKVIALLQRPDLTIYFLVFLLMCVGSINILSASFLDAEDMFGNGYHFFLRYLLFGILSLGVMFFVSRLNYKKLLSNNIIYISYGLVIILLILVDVIGVANKGAQRWLYLGPISIQPSEIAKVLVILITSKILGHEMEMKRRISLVFGNGVKCVFATLGLCALVYAQPDLGTAAIIGALMVALFIIAGLPMKQVYAMLAVCIVGAIAFTVSTPYRLQRIYVWFDPWVDEIGAGYQMVLSLLTIGSGGLTGTEWGHGIGKYMYLPESHTDFAFAVFCQENGFLGAFVLMLLFLILGLALLKIAFGIKDKVGFLLVSGINFLIVGQAFANMAMVCGILPVIGVPLVFISYGGTSMLISSVAIGLALSVYNTEKKRQFLEQAIVMPQNRRNKLRVVSRR